MQNAINFLISIGAEVLDIQEDHAVVLRFHGSRITIRMKSIKVEHLNEDDDLHDYWVVYSRTIFPNGIMDSDLPMFFDLNKVVSMDHCLVVTRVMKTA